MKKQRISKILDTLETLGEIPKQVGRDVLKTFNPLDLLNPTPTSLETKLQEEVDKKGNHTPLKVEKVAGQHELNNLTKDKQTDEQRKLAELRSRLFHQVKGEEKDAIKKQEEKEKEEKEVELTEEQKKQEELKRRLASHQNDAPQGKEKRGGLFGKKKKRSSLAVQENQTEMRGSGKH